MFPRSLFLLFTRRGPSRSGAAARGRARLALERLEDRWVPSAFSYDATTQTLTVTGSTTSPNQFQFSESATVAEGVGTLISYQFTMNGESQTYGPLGRGALSQVIVNGNGGTDTASMNIGYSAELPDGQIEYSSDSIVLTPSGANVDNGFMVLNNFRFTYTYFGSTMDTAQLTDSTTGADRFVTAGIYSYMTDNPNNPTYLEFVSGASHVYGYSANPGHDFVTHYDSAGSVDAFVSSGSAYSYMSGTGAQLNHFFNEAVGFTINYAVATHGNAIAYMLDSPRNDVFVGATSYSYMYSDNANGSLADFDLAQGFQQIYAQSFVGGVDFAYNYDPQHNFLGGDWIVLT